MWIHNWNHGDIVIVAYIVGVITAYFMRRMIMRNDKGNKYDYTHVIVNFVLSPASWLCVVVCFVMWLGDSDYRSKSTSKPPKWL